MVALGTEAVAQGGGALELLGRDCGMQFAFESFGRGERSEADLNAYASQPLPGLVGAGAAA